MEEGERVGNGGMRGERELMLTVGDDSSYDVA